MTQPMRFRRLAALAGLLGAAGWVAWQTAAFARLASPAAQDVQVKAMMSDSPAAPLATTPRAVNSSVTVSFQASQGGEKTNTSGLFAAKTSSSSALQMPEMDNALLAEIADAIYGQLRADLAKGLNVHVVKATYVMTLGSTSAAGHRFSGTTHNKYTGAAFVRVGLMAAQSRIVFRSPSVNAKGESLAGGTDLFAVAEPQAKQRPGLLGALMGISGGSGADAQFVFTASISDPVAYMGEVVGMFKAA